jgi:hypothetical protein
MASYSDSEDFSLPMPRPPVQKIIHVYDISSNLASDRNSKQYKLSHELQDRYVDKSPVYILEFPIDSNITYFDFMIELKNLLILQNPIFSDLNIRLILEGLYSPNPVTSDNLMLTYAPGNIIPPTNIFFVNIDKKMFPFSQLRNFVSLADDANSPNFKLSIALQEEYNKDSLSLYLQGEDINNPNTRTFENFIKLFYSPLNNNVRSLCPFEYILENWGFRSNIKNPEEFLDFFRECDYVQSFQLYLQLAQGHPGLRFRGGYNRKRKSRSYKKKNNKRSIRR